MNGCYNYLDSNYRQPNCYAFRAMALEHLRLKVSTRGMSIMVFVEHWSLSLATLQLTQRVIAILSSFSKGYKHRTRSSY